MNPDWHPLQDELQRWQDAGLTLPVWWRDDDAIAVTPQLKQLTALSGELGLPVHLAVIPRDVEASLAEYVSDQSALVPVVHGWAHQNHAPVNEKKAEFRLHRPIEALIADAEAGLTRLRTLFGDQLRPVFVPPWNRIDTEVTAHLPKLGYRILSTATPRKTPDAAPGIAQVNTHLDPIDWHGTRSLVEPRKLITQTVQLLQDRRTGRADNTEAFGVLTHHLVHDQDIWMFAQDLLHRLLEGPGIPWTAPYN
ncbi:polysaccharide deacetylase [Ruegeria sp. ANG-R]|uniref:polysaccharide deacetylase family protein n=1 Tax=Ruegeria sp. ANG-R TaxID=1577903 RepID=UPI00057CAEBE|nr:polysaccharide deacetylase family protein [Ruegeria sp. ANG-R]KIC41152.1 polysaccharide deacetylase [Ruegeria sp. ANG-R]